MKPCTVCGVITSRSTGRCGEHPRLSGIGANHHVHADARWARLSKRMIARHVGQHGYVCPGDGPEHPAHPTRDLTLDHVLALVDGGAPFDPANTRVLCRSRNSANGARLVNARRANRGSPHAGSALLEVLYGVHYDVWAALGVAVAYAALSPSEAARFVVDG